MCRLCIVNKSEWYSRNCEEIPHFKPCTYNWIGLLKEPWLFKEWANLNDYYRKSVDRLTTPAHTFKNNLAKKILVTENREQLLSFPGNASHLTLHQESFEKTLWNETKEPQTMWSWTKKNQSEIQNFHSQRAHIWENKERKTESYEKQNKWMKFSKNHDIHQLSYK